MQKRHIALCSILLFGFIMIACSNAAEGTDHSVPAPIVWDFHQDSMFVQNANNAFSFKYIGIWPQEFAFFYTYKLSQQPHIVVYSSFAQKETNLKMSVQPLGIINNVHVGVVHATRFSRIGQTIGLHITVPGTSLLAWNLPLLKQQIEEPHPDTIEAFTDAGRKEAILPVLFNGPVMKEQVAYFGPTASTQSSAHRTYIFIRMDSPAITSITKEQYLAIAGSDNFQE